MYAFSISSCVNSFNSFGAFCLNSSLKFSTSSSNFCLLTRKFAFSLSIKSFISSFRFSTFFLSSGIVFSISSVRSKSFCSSLSTFLSSMSNGSSSLSFFICFLSTSSSPLMLGMSSTIFGKSKSMSLMTSSNEKNFFLSSSEVVSVGLFLIPCSTRFMKSVMLSSFDVEFLRRNCLYCSTQFSIIFVSSFLKSEKSTSTQRTLTLFSMFFTRLSLSLNSLILSSKISFVGVYSVMFFVIGLGFVSSLKILRILSLRSSCSGVTSGLTVFSSRKMLNDSENSFSQSTLNSLNEFNFSSDSLVSSCISLYSLYTISWIL